MVTNIATALTPWGSRTSSPTDQPSQVIAKPSSSRKPSTALKNPLSTRHPMKKPPFLRSPATPTSVLMTLESIVWMKMPAMMWSW
jgi:hypothetical protein